MLPRPRSDRAHSLTRLLHSLTRLQLLFSTHSKRLPRLRSDRAHSLTQLLHSLTHLQLLFLHTARGWHARAEIAHTP
jgi:hypothetical protein